MGSLAEIQKAIIIGCLLGDGAMRCKTNALLEINHSLHQKSYVDWKYSKLQNLVATGPKARKGKGVRFAYRFVTRSLPELTQIYKRFYSDNGKVIPVELKLHPLTLAVWFMDDGSKSYRSAYLNTQKFNVDSQRRLIELLMRQHDIKAYLNKDKIYYRLRIAVGSVDKLKRLIKPYLLPEFEYKLP